MANVITTLENQGRAEVFDLSLMAVGATQGLMVVYGPYNMIRQQLINLAGAANPMLAMFLAESATAWMSAVVAEVVYKGFIKPAIAGTR